MKTLRTTRLSLRPLDACDATLYRNLYVDPTLMRHIAEPLSPQSAQDRFGSSLRQQSERRQQRIVVESASGIGIGLVALFRDGGSAEMGIMLLAAAHGRGFATEAMAAVRDHAFEQEGIELLWIRQHPSNAAVTTMMQKLGFLPLPEIDPASGFRRWELDRQRWQADLAPRGGDGAVHSLK
jgi:ribosomal-protein-alanine N-acetyltransferase